MKGVFGFNRTKRLIALKLFDNNINLQRKTKIKNNYTKLSNFSKMSK